LSKPKRSKKQISEARAALEKARYDAAKRQSRLDAAAIKRAIHTDAPTREKLAGK
jgi:hypothetical protein